MTAIIAGIEHIEGYKEEYRIYQPERRSDTIAYVDSINEALIRLKEEGYTHAIINL